MLLQFSVNDLSDCRKLGKGFCSKKKKKSSLKPQLNLNATYTFRGMTQHLTALPISSMWFSTPCLPTHQLNFSSVMFIQEVICLPFVWHAAGHLMPPENTSSVDNLRSRLADAKWSFFLIWEGHPADIFPAKGAACFKNSNSIHCEGLIDTLLVDRICINLRNEEKVRLPLLQETW